MKSQMNISTDDQIERFIQDAKFVDEEKGATLNSLREIILKICPDAQEEIKYGGLVFNVDTELICGIFLRKKHISLEFSFGVLMSDPDKYLEGNGKYRRHLKIFNIRDIKDKEIKYFVGQSFDIKH